VNGSLPESEAAGDQRRPRATAASGLGNPSPQDPLPARSGKDATPAPDEPVPDYPMLDYPADGVPPLTDTPQAYRVAHERLASGQGPLALDTERAHGFRYSPKAYLIQLRRAGAGTVLLDPIALSEGRPRADFSALASDLADVEWIIHAATQDLPCLAEVGLVPQHLFDTELAARLLNLPKVNLSAVMELALGVGLRKAHSADDWSTRPLPSDWLVYAALDVERLADLRDWLDDQLVQAGKREWAAQEFAHLVEHASDIQHFRTESWRRTSGIHEVHSRRGLQVVRDLWERRDAIAAATDSAPGRVLPDRAIIALATMFDGDEPQVTAGLLRRLPGYWMRRAWPYERDWVDALRRAASRPKGDLPPRTAAHEGPPPPRLWEGRRPQCYARWNRVRPALVKLADELAVPLENLVAPDAIRSLLWDSPDATSPVQIDGRLAALDVRPWQRDLVTPVIAASW